jgi:hypothetical protein
MVGSATSAWLLLGTTDMAEAAAAAKKRVGRRVRPFTGKYVRRAPGASQEGTSRSKVEKSADFSTDQGSAADWRTAQ